MKLSFYARVDTRHVRVRTVGKAYVAVEGAIYYEIRRKDLVTHKPRWINIGRDFDKAKITFLDEESKERLREQGADVAPTPPPEPEGERTLKGAAEKYLAGVELAIENKKRGRKTLLAYRRTLELFRESCKKVDLSTIVADDVFAFESFLRKHKNNYSDRYVYNNFLNVMSFLKFAGVRTGIKAKDWPEKPERLVEAYSDEELESIWAVCDKHAAEYPDDRLFLECLNFTGMRISELANSRYSNLQFRDSTWTIHARENYRTKNKAAQRVIPVPFWLRDALKERMVGREKTDLVFPASRGGVDGHLIRVTSRVLAEAGVEGRKDNHKFRATFITRMLRGSEDFKPFDVFDVMAMVGHKDPKIVMAYYKRLKASSPEMQEKINAASRRYPQRQVIPMQRRAVGD